MHTTDCSLRKAVVVSSVLVVPKSNPILSRSRIRSSHGRFPSFITLALSRNPLPELGARRICVWHKTVAELYLEIAQFLKSNAPNECQIGVACSPVETNTIECLNALRCHGTSPSFRILPVFEALLRNPIPELGVGRVMLWHVAVAEELLEFTQFLIPFAPNWRPISLACPPVKTNTIESSNALSCHRGWLLFRFISVSPALSRNPYT